MITTKGTTEVQHTESKYINPGVHEVKITSITASEPAGGSAFYQLFFEDRNAKTVDIKLYATDKALTATLAKIKHMATKVVDEKDLDAISGKNHTEYATKVSRLISNKWFRIKLCGEVIPGKTLEDGSKKNNWTKAVIGYYVSGKTPAFAEKLDTPTRLKYDPTNKFDLKQLPEDSQTSDTETSTYDNMKVDVNAVDVDFLS